MSTIFERIRNRLLPADEAKLEDVRKDRLAEKARRAIVRDDLPALAALHEQGLDVEARLKWIGPDVIDVEWKEHSAWTLLHVACLEGKFDIAHWLIEHGAPLDAKTWQNYTPMHIAAAKGHADIVSLIASYGMKVSHEYMSPSEAWRDDPHAWTSIELLARNGIDYTGNEHLASFAASRARRLGQGTAPVVSGSRGPSRRL